MEAKGQGENFTKCVQETKPIMCSTGEDHHCRSELVLGIKNRVSYYYNTHPCNYLSHSIVNF